MLVHISVHFECIKRFYFDTGDINAQQIIVCNSCYRPYSTYEAIIASIRWQPASVSTDGAGVMCR